MGRMGGDELVLLTVGGEGSKGQAEGAAGGGRAQGESL